MKRARAQRAVATNIARATPHGRRSTKRAEAEATEAETAPARHRVRARTTPRMAADDSGASGNQPPGPDAKLRFEWVQTSSIRSYENVLAKPNQRQHRQLMSSIRTYGFVTPMVLAADNTVIVGEARFVAAKELGLARVPVVYAEHLTKATIQQYRVTDNMLSSLREWDDEALRLELSRIELVAPGDLNVEAMGITFGEWDAILHQTSGEADPDDAIQPPLKSPISRVGDVWEIDDHEIHCGSATSDVAVSAMLRGCKLRTVFADGPWNVPYKGHMGGKGRIKHPEFVEGRGEKTEQEFLSFQTSWMSLIKDGLIQGGLLYAAIDWRGLRTTLEAARAAGFELINLLVWSKLPGAGLGSFYRSAHEIILVLRAPGALHTNHVMLGLNGRTRANVLTYPGASSFGSGREALHLHASPKPIALVGDLLLDCSKKGDWVADPFSGSGTTLIAAQKTGRRARVMDLDPRYVDVAVRRYEQIFGRAPRLKGTGETLEELEATRACDGQPTVRSRTRRRIT